MSLTEVETADGMASQAFTTFLKTRDARFKQYFLLILIFINSDFDREHLQAINLLLKQ